MGDLLEHAKFKAAITEVMRVVSLANAYISDQEPCAIEAGKDVGEPLLTQRIVAQHHYFGFRYARPQAAADLRKRARWLPPPTVVRFTDFSPKG